MILVVNFNMIENSLLDKVATELGIGDRCKYLDEAISSTGQLISWKLIPILGLGFCDDEETIDKFYAVGGASFIRKPDGYEGLKKITGTAIQYWLDVSFMPSDFLTDAA